MVKEIDSQSLQNRLALEGGIHLLDIRSQAEVIGGMLPGSEHLPMHLLPLKVGELPADKEIVLYCRSGVRSHHACKYLMQQGYENVINLRGGIIDWARNGLEIVNNVR